MTPLVCVTVTHPPHKCSLSTFCVSIFPGPGDIPEARPALCQLRKFSQEWAGGAGALGGDSSEQTRRKRGNRGPGRGVAGAKALMFKASLARALGGQGQRSHGVSGLSRVKPLVPGSGERLILLTEGRELG